MEMLCLTAISTITGVLIINPNRRQVSMSVPQIRKLGVWPSGSHSYHSYGNASYVGSLAHLRCNRCCTPIFRKKCYESPYDSYKVNWQYLGILFCSGVYLSSSLNKATVTSEWIRRKNFFNRQYFKEFDISEVEELKNEITYTLDQLSRFKSHYDIHSPRNSDITLRAIIELKWCIKEIDSYFYYMNARIIGGTIGTLGIVAILSAATGELQKIRKDQVWLKRKTSNT